MGVEDISGESIQITDSDWPSSTCLKQNLSPPDRNLDYEASCGGIGVGGFLLCDLRAVFDMKNRLYRDAAVSVLVPFAFLPLGGNLTRN